jgi:hypothetical protein
LSGRKRGDRWIGVSLAPRLRCSARTKRDPDLNDFVGIRDTAAGAGHASRDPCLFSGRQRCHVPLRRAIAMISLRQHAIGMSTLALSRGANAVDLVRRVGQQADGDEVVQRGQPMRSAANQRPRSEGISHQIRRGRRPTRCRQKNRVRSMLRCTAPTSPETLTPGSRHGIVDPPTR